MALPISPPLGLRKSTELGPNQDVALKTLQELFAVCLVTPSIPFDQALTAVAEKLVDVDDKRKRERAKAAIEALINKGKIKSDNKNVMPI